MNRTGLLSLVVGCSLVTPALAIAAVGVGDAFPPLVSAGLAGAGLPDTAGKVVLVDFWASWCAPCKASFPAYGRLNAEFAPRGLVIIAVSVDEDTSAYDAFVRKFGPPFFVTLDKGQSLVRKVQVPTMPTSYLIDRTGRVRYSHPGFRGAATEQVLRREIEALLSEKTP